MKYKYISWLLLILLVSNFAFSYKLYIDRKDFLLKISNKAHQHTSDESQLYSMLVDLLMINSKMHYNNEGYKFPDIIVADLDGNEKYFSSLLDGKYKLIFKYSHKNCSSCIETELKSFVEMSKRVGNDRMLILAEHKNVRELNAFMKDRNIAIPIYRIPEDGLKGFMERENMPFVCLMNEDLVANFLFIPIKEIEDFSKQYYDVIYSRFFK